VHAPHKDLAGRLLSLDDSDDIELIAAAGRRIWQIGQSFGHGQQTTLNFGQTPQIVLVALQLFQLTAHGEQALLGVDQRFITFFDIFAGDGVEVGLQLIDVVGDPRVALGKSLDLGRTLFDKNVDLFQLLERLLVSQVGELKEPGQRQLGRG